MHSEQRQQASELLRAQGITRAVFAHPHSITWLTGFAPPIQLGMNLFAGGPSLLWMNEGHYTLLTLDGLAGAAAGVADDPDCDVVTYRGYTIDAPIDSRGHMEAAWREIVGSVGAGAQVGVEAAMMPVMAGAALNAAGVRAWRAIDGWLTDLRMVKTAEELAKLRANFVLTDIGHAAARRAVRPGRREIDVWTDIHAAIQQAAGQRVPLGNDCAVGYRQGNIGGWPEGHVLGPQDSMIVDLSTVKDGYWSDSCVTYFAGPPTDEQRKLHAIITDALAYAKSLIKPGAVAKEIDAKVRAFIAATGYPVYPHHTGHGVGVSGHEEPRIVPYNDRVLEEGMVILLEPGIYLPGVTGVRQEDALLVTSDGATLLTHSDKRI
ncbi:MAG: Xaa-Pro peptidase family protein [Caldilineaceae bacterium]